MKTNQLAIVGFMALAIISGLSSCKKESTSKPGPAVAPKPLPNDYVQTPGGLRLKSNVYLIEAGFHLSLNNGHVFKVRDNTNEVMSDFGELHSAVTNPQGLQQGSKFNNSRSVRTPAYNPGWITWAQWNNTTANMITSISTTWSVPVNPVGTDLQLLYLFDGLSEQDNLEIMQPVLQYGNNNAFGGYSWVISNWYVWGTGAAYTTPAAVTTNTPLTGTISYTGKTGSSYDYTSTFGSSYTNPMNITIGQVYNSGTATIPSVEVQKWAYETLEAYHYTSSSGFLPGVVASNDYPAQPSCNMESITLQTNYAAAPLSWSAMIGVDALFGEHTIAPNNFSNGYGDVELFFHPATFFITTTTNTLYSTNFSLNDGSTVIEGGGSVSPTVNVDYIVSPTLPVNSNSTITMHIQGGHIPVNPSITWGSGSTSWGVVSGSTVTFNGVNVTAPSQTFRISFQ